jgi:hypothetical protein
MFSIVDKHFSLIKGTIKAKGLAIIHGDGQVYFDKKASKDHYDYSRPANKAAKFFVEFTSVDQVPTTIDALHLMMFDNDKKNTIAANAPKELKQNNVIIMDDEPIIVKPVSEVAELKQREEEAKRNFDAAQTDDEKINLEIEYLEIKTAREKAEKAEKKKK